VYYVPLLPIRILKGPSGQIRSSREKSYWIGLDYVVIHKRHITSTCFRFFSFWNLKHRKSIQPVSEANIYSIVPSFFAFERKGANLFCFLSSLPLLPHPSRSVWLLPVISLLLTITVAGAGSPIHLMGKGFVGPKKKTIAGLLVFNPLCLFKSITFRQTKSGRTIPSNSANR